MYENDSTIGISGKHGKDLTEREYEVLKLIVQGKSNNEIAETLSISVHTAKAHVASIMQKMALNDRVLVAVNAVRKGLA